MRDIAQVSITLYNPYAGFVIGGSKIQEHGTQVITTDGFLDPEGFLNLESVLTLESELWG